MRKLLFIVTTMMVLMYPQLLSAQADIQIPDYHKMASSPNANFFTLVKEVRTKIAQKEAQLKARGIDVKKNHAFREEFSLFERWVYNWQDKIGPDGKFPNSASGWLNAKQDHPELLAAKPELTQSGLLRTSAATWTSIGPTDSAISNGWTFGGGIGRINVVKKHPVNKNVLFAGAAVGGIFKSTNNGASWTPLTDNFAGLGVSDLVIDQNNPNIMYMATGDYDAAHINSIGVYKSIDGGTTWTATGLTFTLNNDVKIAHVYIDPENSNTLYAGTTFHLMKSTDAGATWSQKMNLGVNSQFNDIIKVVNGGTKYVFVTDKWGELYRSTDDGETFTSVHNNGKNNRLDFAYSPAAPTTLYLLASTNPAFAKYNILTNTTTAYSNVTNPNPADDNANFNTQQGYNQVIVVSPTNGDSIWVGEFSGGKLSVNGGTTWLNKYNGYYDPANPATSWGGYYVHSDHHHFEFVGSDSMLIANDGGVYVGKISTDSYKQCFNGLVTTQSYTMALFDAEPNNLITGNQDNDGSSRVFSGGNSKWYGAQAGDGTATAISRGNSNIRYLGGTKGSLSYRTDGFVTNFSGNSITTPAGAPFVWDLQMHNTDGSIIYGGFAEIHKMTGAPTGTWTSLNSGATTNVKSITLSNNNATTQKIIIIDDANNVRKSDNETTWSTITKPGGVNFNSIYADKTNWDTLFATATGYAAANKVFFSSNNGGTWTNVTKNMPNIVMKKILLYESSDSVFVATELGVFQAKVSELLNGAVTTPWSKYGGATLPNVRVDDMEISYAKKQLFISTFGRGVWVADLSTTSLPLNNIQFTYVNTAVQGEYKLMWNITANNIAQTSLQKSINGTQFTNAATFTDGNKQNHKGYAVQLTNDVEYYRLQYTSTSGNIYYSGIIKLSKKSGGASIKVYPNPTSDFIRVNSSNKIDAVVISKLNGQQVAFATPKNNFYTFDMSLLPKGMYLMKVIDEKGNTFTEKVIRN